MKGFYNSIRLKKETLRFFYDNSRLIFMALFLLLGVLFGVVMEKNNWFSGMYDPVSVFSDFVSTRMKMRDVYKRQLFELFGSCGAKGQTAGSHLVSEKVHCFLNGNGVDVDKHTVHQVEILTLEGGGFLEFTVKGKAGYLGHNFRRKV